MVVILLYQTRLGPRGTSSGITAAFPLPARLQRYLLCGVVRGIKRSSAYDFPESAVRHALEVNDWILRIRQTSHEFCHPWICDDSLVGRVTRLTGFEDSPSEYDRLVVLRIRHVGE
jgi:hypothetical protein